MFHEWCHRVADLVVHQSRELDVREDVLMQGAFDRLLQVGLRNEAGDAGTLKSLGELLEAEPVRAAIRSSDDEIGGFVTEYRAHVAGIDTRAR